MKRILLIISLLLSASPSLADDIRGAGSTSQCFDLFVSDSSSSVGAGLASLAYNSGSLTCYYFRNESGTGETATSITLAPSTLGTYASGAFKEISAANMPGHYEFCPPDAALAAGASAVTFQCKGAANMAPANLRVLLTPPVGSPPDYYGGLAGTPTTTSLQLNASDTRNIRTGQGGCMLSGAAVGQCFIVDSFNSGTRTATISPALSAAPSSGDLYVIGAQASALTSIASSLASTSVLGAVWDVLVSQHKISGSFGEAVCKGISRN